eukprot:TRINITY_DN221_c0_g1_i7.p1 TRINITY_DN221_c0_g1~~TRINITY_DN221_c0_g1_i7.p1  ORF type:complete len:319 (-),score=3.96 TRINITY_DN221_c0_g1_i7:419-1375(-)
MAFPHRWGSPAVALLLLIAAALAANSGVDAHSSCIFPLEYTWANACRRGGINGAIKWCNGPCPRDPVRKNYKIESFRRGQWFPFDYYRNNHNGGFMRLSLVPMKHRFSHEAHNRNAFLWTCWDVGLRDCPRRTPHDCGTDRQGKRYRQWVRMPNVFPTATICSATRGLAAAGGRATIGRAPASASAGGTWPTGTSRSSNSGAVGGAAATHHRRTLGSALGSRASAKWSGASRRNSTAASRAASAGGVSSSRRHALPAARGVARWIMHRVPFLVVFVRCVCGGESKGPMTVKGWKCLVGTASATYRKFDYTMSGGQRGS